MGTTLTGTTPQDTYDSLIKVTDNGPISGTAKYLSDGLGNDSVLALSTARVGVGTSSPATTLDVAGTLRVSSATPTEEFYNTTNGDVWASIFGQASGTGSGASLVFSTKRDGNSATDKMTITQAGNVGIGTTSPVTLLDVRGEVSVAYNVNYGIRFYNEDRNNWSFIGNSIATGGANANLRLGDSTGEVMKITGGVVELTKGQLKFPATQVTSADPNTLDDYEEGTFTPTVVGTSTAGTATYTQQNGRYTKIGRLVQFEIFLVYSAGTGTGNIEVSGLPFTIGGSSYPSFTIGAFDDIPLNADNYVLCWGLVGTNQMRLAQMITGGGTQTQVAYDASGGMQISGTYSV